MAVEGLQRVRTSHSTSGRRIHSQAGAPDNSKGGGGHHQVSESTRPIAPEYQPSDQSKRRSGKGRRPFRSLPSPLAQSRARASLKTSERAQSNQLVAKPPGAVSGDVSNENLEGGGILDNATASSGVPIATKNKFAPARTPNLLEMLGWGKFPHYFALLGKIPAFRGLYNGCGSDRSIYIMHIESCCSLLPSHRSSEKPALRREPHSGRSRPRNARCFALDLRNLARAEQLNDVKSGRRRHCPADEVNALSAGGTPAPGRRGGGTNTASSTFHFRRQLTRKGWSTCSISQ